MPKYVKTIGMPYRHIGLDTSGFAIKQYKSNAIKYKPAGRWMLLSIRATLFCLFLSNIAQKKSTTIQEPPNMVIQPLSGLDECR